MARGPKVKLDRGGISRILKKSPEVAQMVDSAARRVAANIDPEVGAFVSPYTTDRRAAAVHCRAEHQLRDGALTRAAAAAGLEVHSR